MNVDPAADSVRIHLGSMKWDLTVFDHPFVCSSYYALFVDFAVHHLDALIRKYDGELRYRLLRLMDCYLPMVHDILSPENNTAEQVAANLDQHWWLSHRDRLISSVPCEDSLDMHCTSRVHISQPHFTQFNPIAASKALFDRNGVDQLIKSGWPQKHRMEHFIGTCTKLSTEPFPKSRYPPAIVYALQWWCVFQLGMYRHSSVAVLDYNKRIQWVNFWDTLRTAHIEWCISTFRKIRDTPVLLLFAIKEFTLYCIRNYPAIHASLCERSSWDAYDRCCVSVIDEYRRTGVDRFADYMKTQYSIGLYTKAPCHYWEHMNRYLTIPTEAFKAQLNVEGRILSASAAVSGTSSDPVPPAPFIYACVGQLLDRQGDIGTIPPLREDVYHLNHVHPKWIDLFLLEKRILHWTLVWLGACEPSIQLCLYSLVRYYRRKCGKNSTLDTIATIYKLYPRTYYLWYYIIKGRMRWSFVRQIPLPFEAVYPLQLDTLESVHSTDAPGNVDWILYCPNCRRICSIWVPKFHPKKPPPRRAVELSGFLGVVADHLTGKWYCGRKTGQNAPICANTELEFVHSTGRMTLIGNKTLVNCSSCTKHTELGTNSRQYSGPTWMCAVCIIKKRKQLREMHANWHRRETRRLAKEAKASQGTVVVSNYFPAFDWVKSRRSFKLNRRAASLVPEEKPDLLYDPGQTRLSKLERLLRDESVLTDTKKKRKATVL